MREVAFDDVERAVVERLRRAYVPLDILRCHAPSGAVPVERVHREAAVYAVDVFARARGRHPEPTDPAVLTGRPLDGARDLLGQAIDPSTGRLRPPTGAVFVPQLDPFRRCDWITDRPDDAVGGPFLDRTSGRRLWLVEDPRGVPLGLADVFEAVTDRVELEDQLFESLVRRVLRVGSSALEGWFWVGDWSPYFDEGNEWRGAYAWTVRTDEQHVVVVGTSATD